jgi:hypothetical protein
MHNHHLVGGDHYNWGVLPQFPSRKNNYCPWDFYLMQTLCLLWQRVSRCSARWYKRRGGTVVEGSPQASKANTVQFCVQCPRVFSLTRALIQS